MSHDEALLSELSSRNISKFTIPDVMKMKIYRMQTFARVKKTILELIESGRIHEDGIVVTSGKRGKPPMSYAVV